MGSTANRYWQVAKLGSSKPNQLPTMFIDWYSSSFSTNQILARELLCLKWHLILNNSPINKKGHKSEFWNLLYKVSVHLGWLFREGSRESWDLTCKSPASPTPDDDQLFLTSVITGRAQHRQGAINLLSNYFFSSFKYGKGQELNSAATLASQPAAGHSLSFTLSIVIMTLCWGLFVWGWPQKVAAEFGSHDLVLQ